MNNTNITELTADFAAACTQLLYLHQIDDPATTAEAFDTFIEDNKQIVELIGAPPIVEAIMEHPDIAATLLANYIYNITSK